VEEVQKIFVNLKKLNIIHCAVKRGLYIRSKKTKKEKEGFRKTNAADRAGRCMTTPGVKIERVDEKKKDTGSGN